MSEYDGEYDEENITVVDDEEYQKAIQDYLNNPSEFTILRRKYLSEGMSYNEAFDKAADEINSEED